MKGHTWLLMIPSPALLWRDSLEPSPFPKAILPLHGARLHGLNHLLLLLQIGKTICRMLAIIVQFTQGAIIGGIICSLNH